MVGEQFMNLFLTRRTQNSDQNRRLNQCVWTRIELVVELQSFCVLVVCSNTADAHGVHTAIQMQFQS